MENSRGLFGAGMTTTIDALEIARISLEERGPEEPSPEIAASVRRIARSIRGSGISQEDPAIRRAALALEEAGSEELAPRLEALLERLRHTSQPAAAVLLIVSANSYHVEAASAALAGPNREVRTATTAAEAEAILESDLVSLILLDLFLPDTDGRNLLVRLRERPGTAAIPIIVLAEPSGAQPKTECFALGADAYFERPVDPEVLAGAASRLLQIAGERSRESRQDPLTRLPNRAAFREAYQRAVSLAERLGDPLSIAIIDLDHFKHVNDTYGHKVGDEVLRRFARVVSGSLRRSDLLARWGGEEFVVLFPHTQERGAFQALEKALESMADETFRTEDGREFQITFSAGVATVPPDMTVDDAVSEADRYLYLAKSAGRARILSAESSFVPPRERILLAEQDDLVASVVTQRLEQEGFEVEVHAWGGPVEGYQGPFSLVLLDVETDEDRGFELLASLRLQDVFTRVPVVLLTSIGNPDPIVRGFEFGTSDYILKPFSSTELVARVLRILKKTKR